MPRLIPGVTVVLAIVATTAMASPTPKELYESGQLDFNRSDYAAAIAKWMVAYERSGASGLLYNIAQAYRLSGDCKQALATYKRFIAIDPATEVTEQRALAAEFVRELDPCAAAPIIAHSVPTHRHTKKLAGLVTGSAGLVLFVTGLGFGFHASTLGDEVTRSCSLPATPCDWSGEKGKDAAGRRDATIGYALDAIGAGAFAVGAILYYLRDRDNEVRVAPLTGLPHESGATISWSRSW